MTLTARTLFGPKPTDTPTFNGRVFAKYGDAAAAPATLSGVPFLITKRSDTVVIDDTNLEAVSIISQPEIGWATTAGLGRIHVDLKSVKDTNLPENVSICLSVTRNGVTAPETLVVPVIYGTCFQGTPRGRFANLERDANGRVIVEPGENHRKVYVRAAGLTRDQISARHGGATVNGAFFRDTLARDAGGVEQAVFYGETEEYALDEDAADICFGGITQAGEEASNWLILEDGQTYTANLSGGTGGHWGEGDLHPTLVTGGGDPANRPIYFDFGPSAPIFSSVIRDIEITRDFANGSNKQIGFNDPNFLILDGVKSNAEVLTRALDSHFSRDVTYSRFFSTDTYRTRPVGTDLTQWSQLPSRYQGSKTNNIEGALFMESVILHSGYQTGYMYNRNYEAPNISLHPVDIYSHSIYCEDGTISLFSWNCMFSDPALLCIQGRGGQTTYQCSFSLSNSALLFGDGKSNIEIAGTSGGDSSYAVSCVFTDPTAKDVEGSNFKKYLGVDNPSQESGIIDCLFANTNTLGDLVSTSTFGTPSTYYWQSDNASGAIVNAQGSVRGGGPEACIIYNWEGVTDDIGGAVAGDLADASLAGFGADFFGGTPNAFDTLDQIEAMPEPWAAGRAFWEFCRTKAGQAIGSTRTTPEICYWRQHPSGHTPDISVIHLNWSTNDVAGTVAGDSIALEGRHLIQSFATPNKNTLANLYLDGGIYEQYGSKSEFTGDVLTGGEIVTDSAGQIFFGDCTVAEQTSLTCQGGRFAVTGALSGLLSTTVSRHGQFLVYGGGSITVPSGQTLSLNGGHCKVGFDGDTGGAGAITLEAGSTFSVAPYTRATTTFINNKAAFWKLGADVTGQTSGAVGRAEIHRGEKNRNGSTWFVSLDAVLQAGDVLNGEYVQGEYDSAELPTIPDTSDIATVGAIEGLEWPQIREVRSGRFGTNAPNVASTVALAGALEIDLRAVAGAASQTIVNVDTVTGTFSGVTALGLGARDLVVTVDGAAGTVVFDVTAGGTGQITQTSV